MSQPETPSIFPLRGRFIVELLGERRVGLTADEAALLLETPESREAVVYQIHRVCEDGRLELVGVSAAALRRSTCIAFTRENVRDARRDYDRVIEQSKTSPPPCRIELRLLRDAAPDGAAYVAMMFPEICTDAVNQWLASTGTAPGDSSGTGPAALQNFDAEALNVVKQATLEAGRAVT